jgi:hypothetical protein
MPTLRLRKHLPGDEISPRAEDSLAWHVPIDDESHYAVQLDIALNPRTPRRPTDSQAWVDPTALGELVLAGTLGMEDVEWDASPAYARVRRDRLVGKMVVPDAEWVVTDKVKVQDVVSQVGQGRFADRSEEHLGRTDETVVSLRGLWERELQALAEGRPLKNWYRSEEHITGQ